MSTDRKSVPVDRRQFMRLGGGVAAAGLLAACGQGGNGSSVAPTGPSPTAGEQAGAAELTNTVRFGHPSPFQPVYNFAVYPIASSILMEQYGVGIEPTVFTGFTPIAGAFISDEIDISYMSLTSLLKARSEGLPMVAPFGYTVEHPFVMIVSQNTTSWQDIEGRGVAVHAPSSLTELVAQTMVAAELGSTDAATYEYISGTPNRLAAMQAGEIDATIVSFTGALQAEKEGYASILGLPWDYDQLSDQTASTLVVPTSAVEEQRDKLSLILSAFGEAYRRVAEEDPQALTEEALATGHYAEFDTDVWVEALSKAQEIGMWPEGGRITEERYQKAVDLLVSGGQINEDQALPYSEVVVDTFFQA